MPWRSRASSQGATAVWTVGVFASLYAGYLNPGLRVTSSNLSSIINGVATNLAGTVLAQLLLVPAALAIVYVAERL